MLQMWFGSQLCEATGSCFGHQLFYNNIASVPHFLIPQVENILATNAVHNELNVGTVILWSLQSSNLTTCDNSLRAVVKAKTSRLHPTTAEDLKTAFRDGLNDLQS